MCMRSNVFIENDFKFESMKYFIVIINLFLFMNAYSQISKVTLYHYSFFENLCNAEHPYEEQIKVYPSTKKSVKKSKELKKEITVFLAKLDTSKNFIDLSGANEVEVLVEISYRNGDVKRIYSWFNGEIFYHKKLFPKSEEFIKLLEKYFPKNLQ